MENRVQILHLEDSALDAELIQAALDSAGIPCEITRVQTSDDFDAALQRGEYELILADFQLPSYDGLSALDLAQELRPEVPFIFVSGTLGEDAAIKALTKGAIDYVTKQKLSRLAPAVTRALREAEDRMQRRHAEDALQKNNALLERIFSSTEFMMAYLDADFNFIRVNRAYAESDGRTPEFFVEKNYFSLYPNPENEAVFRRVVETGEPYVVYAQPFVYPEHPERGTSYWNWTLQPIKEADKRVSGLVLSLVDVTEREKAVISQRESDALYRTLVEQASDGIFVTDSYGKFIDVNPSGCALLGYTRDEILNLHIWDTLLPESRSKLPAELSAMKARSIFIAERTLAIKGGGLVPVEISGKTLDNGNLLGIVRDITERKLAEEALRKSEQKFRAMAENIPNVVYQCKNDSRYTFLYLNDAIETLTGYPKEDFLEKGLSFFDLYHPDDLKTMPTPAENIISDINRKPFHLVYRVRHKSGEWRWVDEWGTGVTDEEGNVELLEGLMIDITERKRHELERESIITVSTTLRRATTKSDILNVIMDQLMELFKAEGAVLALPDPQTKGFVDAMGRGPVGERIVGLMIPPETGVCDWVIKNRRPYLTNQADQDAIFYRPDLLGASHCLAAVPLIAQEQTIGALWIARQVNITEQDLGLLNAIADIAANAIHRVTLHEQTEQQLHHLMALHQIDIAISANFDLNVTLNVILKNVKDELKVDAASILLLNPITHTLDYAAGAGFRTRNIENSHVRLGHGYAGRAAQTYETVFARDLSQAPGTFSRSSLLAVEEFLSHYATPLIVKGQVKGVLEVFHRKTFDSTPEWIDYFETLATQAAIAIENASLFENLQRSNMELMLAYDATIEGWSRALDLRDRETEGHTRRVTEMALKLAEKLGMRGMEMTNLRRGALLHDIGKMGVPDSILLKPGPLSDDDWGWMRKHPVYALEMLSPIPYLKHALDIPYYHHEKWDGTGYPLGLKGEAIPLSARLFAIVDVFDALTSDRPYRPAWPREKVLRYIQEQSGISFDPQIVEAFLRAME
jgi:PAS domain S-box-containing protein/putative nucleotidyltransferase with HDIG domain